jgi:Tfp pilus assembly protein PilP
MAMKLTTGILAMAVMMGGSVATQAVAQNSDAIDNARSAAKSLQQGNGSSAVAPATPAKAKPAPGAPAPAVKPATIPGSGPSAAAKPDHASAQNNQLQRVNVVSGTDKIQIEISSTQSVTPKLSKLSSPDRVLVELPETVIASSQSKIAVGSAGVKSVRIGMDGKTPPTTSVVIDLEKPLAYELTPGPAGKVILTLHTQQAAPSVAKNNVAPAVSAAVAKPAAPAAKPVVVAVAKPAVTPAVKPAPALAAKPAATTATKPGIVAVSSPKVATPKTELAKAPAPKLVPPPFKAETTQAKVVSPVKPGAPAPISTAPASKIAAAPVAKSVVVPSPKTEASVAKTEAPSAGKPAPVTSEAAPKSSKPEEKKWAMTGKRDPFFSPVVQQNGSGCSSGKKCLEIGAINLRGVVKSDTGFIAVVTNSLNKAYFLRENDPVFNGYVVKITGDSVIFQETIQDKLGKSFTREVVKRIFTPAV